MGKRSRDRVIYNGRGGGVVIIDAELPDGYTPPSTSMDPDATVTPQTPDEAEARKNLHQLRIALGCGGP